MVMRLEEALGASVPSLPRADDTLASFAASLSQPPLRAPSGGGRSAPSIGVDIVPMEAPDAEECTHMFAESFSAYEPLAVHLGISAQDLAPMAQAMMPEILSSGLSVVARDPQSGGEIVGCVWTLKMQLPSPPAGDSGEAASPFAPSLDPVLALLDGVERSVVASDAQLQQAISAGSVANMFVTCVDVGRVPDAFVVAEALEVASIQRARRAGMTHALSICTNKSTEFLSHHRHKFAPVLNVPLATWALGKLCTGSIALHAPRVRSCFQCVGRLVCHAHAVQPLHTDAPHRCGPAPI